MLNNNITWSKIEVSPKERSIIKNHKPCIIWLTGFSGSGKSTIANALEKKLNNLNIHTYILDGDNLRHGLNKDLGFSDQDRMENIRRVAELAKLFVEAGLIVITAFISPFQKERNFARELVNKNEFIEVFLDTPLEICEKRDPKGLYQKARKGEIRNFTGIDSKYEKPLNPELILKTNEINIEQSIDSIIEYLKKENIRSFAK